MGKPEHPQAFVRLHDEELEIYLARDIWEGLEPGIERLLFAVEGYGRFWLLFDTSHCTQKGATTCQN